MNRRIVWLAAGAWLALGIGLKAWRYADPGPSLERRSEAAVTSLMLAQGWTVDGRLPLTSDGAASGMVFRRAGCADPVVAVVLATGAEVASLAAERLGERTQFLSGGRFSTAPPARGSFGGWFAPGGLALVAVSPGPEADVPCGPPDAALWGALRPTNG